MLFYIKDFSKNSRDCQGGTGEEATKILQKPYRKMIAPISLREYNKRENDEEEYIYEEKGLYY